jgi:hypothetical protein
MPVEKTGNMYNGGSRDASNSGHPHQNVNYNINKQYVSNKNTSSNSNLRKIEKNKNAIASNSNNGNRHRSGIPNSNNLNGYGGKASSKQTNTQGIKKEASLKQLGLNVQNSGAANPNSLQQYHLNQLHSNSHANSRLSSSKPILGGGVAGSKYVVRNREMNYNANGAESKQHSPTRKDPQSSSSGINSKIIRESMSLNYSALKQ